MFFLNELFIILVFKIILLFFLNLLRKSSVCACLLILSLFIQDFFGNFQGFLFKKKNCKIIT